jgi:hypothetical protein
LSDWLISLRKKYLYRHFSLPSQQDGALIGLGAEVAILGVASFQGATSSISLRSSSDATNRSPAFPLKRRCLYYFFMAVVIRYETATTARWALPFIVGASLNDTITVAVWTGFHVRLCACYHTPPWTA